MSSDKECDVDDILCQLEMLTHLKGIEKLQGSESFRERFPEFEGLGIRLSEEIVSQKSILRLAVTKCGQLDDLPVEQLEQELSEEIEQEEE